ncbi:MAG: hypothetical protein AAF685_07495 [Cyanobacteria bacterium P01_C01_bin.89]
MSAFAAYGSAIFAIGNAQTGASFPAAFTAVYVVGFLAAVGIGSVAWYNSKRPAGWEGRDRPNIVPEVKGDASVETSNEETKDS